MRAESRRPPRRRWGMKVIVAGGSTGIGAAVIRALRARGDDVLLADINVGEGKRLMADSNRVGAGHGWFTETDLSQPDAPRHIVDEALERFEGQLDVVFYNAGVLQSRPLGDWTVEQWDLALNINLRAPLLFAQTSAEALARSEHGRLIFTGSTGGLRGHAGMHAYHASKAGLLGLVRSLADELGSDGTTVNAVSPGWIDTPFNDDFWAFQSDPVAAMEALTASIPLGQQGTPEDVVGAVLFLASPDSRYITGQSIVIDGGYTAV